MCLCVFMYVSRRHQACRFRKRATSAPAEGPACGLDFARRIISLYLAWE